MPITVGNRAPVVTIEIPIDGQVASFTDKVPYKISVTDPEDGIDRRRHQLRRRHRSTISLGHDEHAHDLVERDRAATGTFTPA